MSETDEAWADPTDSESFVPAGWDGQKCLIVCQNPRYSHGLRGPQCPWCGGRTHLHQEGTDILIRSQQAGERFAAVVWAALISPFRRREVPVEIELCDPAAAEACEHCTDDIGPVCDERGCLWVTFQATKEAVTEAGERA